MHDGCCSPGGPRCVLDHELRWRRQRHRLSVRRDVASSVREPLPALARRDESLPVGDREIDRRERARGRIEPAMMMPACLLMNHQVGTDPEHGRLQHHAARPWRSRRSRRPRRWRACCSPDSLDWLRATAREMRRTCPWRPAPRHCAGWLDQSVARRASWVAACRLRHEQFGQQVSMPGRTRRRRRHADQSGRQRRCRGRSAARADRTARPGRTGRKTARCRGRGSAGAVARQPMFDGSRTIVCRCARLAPRRADADADQEAPADQVEKTLRREQDAGQDASPISVGTLRLGSTRS